MTEHTEHNGDKAIACATRASALAREASGEAQLASSVAKRCAKIASLRADEAIKAAGEVAAFFIRKAEAGNIPNPATQAIKPGDSLEGWGVPVREIRLALQIETLKALKYARSVLIEYADDIGNGGEAMGAVEILDSIIAKAEPEEAK